MDLGRERRRWQPSPARVLASRVRRPSRAVRARQPVAPDQPLHRRERPRSPLHKLGSGQWEKAKRKAAEQVRDSAAELLSIYARRAARQGLAFRFHAARLRRSLPTISALKKPPTKPPPSTPSYPRHDQPAPHEPAGLRRRGFWQNRSGLARRLCRRNGRASRWRFWRPPRCWPSSITKRWSIALPSGR